MEDASATADGNVVVPSSTTPSTTESFPMVGGDGTYSYTKNSQLQKKVTDSAKGMVEEAITDSLDSKTLLLNASNILRIVDFGCSVGPNTFSNVQNLMELVKTKFTLEGLDLEKIDFQVFFNDHESNDFNTLFASLPSERKYFAAGVPGSFYSRLFPRSSVSFAHSSYALHWLSRAPKDVFDVESSAWNGERIHYAGSGENVVKAYATQFEKDMGIFISARAEEIVGEGMMVLIIPGIPDGMSHSELAERAVFEMLGLCLKDMANEGIIDKAEIESFNMPLYSPSVGEMKQLIEKNGCFSIERIGITHPPLQDDSSLSAHSLTMHLRAVSEGILTKHFGNKATQIIFERFFKKSEEISQFLKSDVPKVTLLFAVLKRK